MQMPAAPLRVLLAVVLATLLVLGWWRTPWPDASTTPTEPAGPTAPTASGGHAKPVTVRYMMWDSAQVPVYRQCAERFMQAHPEIVIRISQAGWGDYWMALSAGFIAQAAPDVFVNHVVSFPQFVVHGVLEDLKPWLERDGVDLSAFPRPLVDVWSRRAGQYALPKDWDTVALVVNLDHARRQGVGLEELRQMEWNPTDGGSFERVMRRLAVDRQGRSAAEAGFDPKRIAVYAYQTPGAGGMAGQTEWSHLAGSTGFRFQPAPWAQPLAYDDPRLASTIDWIAGLPGKGLSAPWADTQSLGAPAMFVAGRAAMVPDGSWMIGYYARNAAFDHAWVPLPKGPSGRRATILNGLGDSMWAGSKVKPQAWQWMKFMASPECQTLMAESAVMFPARHGMAERAVQRHADKGIDASAFLTMAAEDTMLMPIADRSAQVEGIMKSALESVFLGQQGATPALELAQRRIDLVQQAAKR